MSKSRLAKRILDLPPYLFAELDRAKAKLVAEGKEVISLGIGDPDMPTPEPIIEALKREAGESANHRYPSYEGLLAFRQAVVEWYEKRTTAREQTFIVRVDFVDVSADALAMLREFLHQYHRLSR